MMPSVSSIGLTQRPSSSFRRGAHLRKKLRRLLLRHQRHP
jgi:hypothetical protein